MDFNAKIPMPTTAIFLQFQILANIDFPIVFVVPCFLLQLHQKETRSVTDGKDTRNATDGIFSRTGFY